MTSSSAPGHVAVDLLTTELLAPTPASLVAASMFFSFPKLPLELQRNVWKFTIVPRIVEVRFAKCNGTAPLEHDFIADIPATLHVCQDSRKEALRMYTSDFRTQHSQNGMYFNFELGTLFLRGGWKMEHLVGRALEDARRAVPSQVRSFISGLPERERFYRVILKAGSVLLNHLTPPYATVVLFPGLKELWVGWEETQALRRNGDSQGCETCQLHLITNRTYFFNEEELAHFDWHTSIGTGSQQMPRARSMIAPEIGGT